MFLRHKKNESEVFTEQLVFVRSWTKDLIDKYNPDAEDIVCRSYRATGVLLELLDPQEEENEQA